MSRVGGIDTNSAGNSMAPANITPKEDIAATGLNEASGIEKTAKEESQEMTAPKDEYINSEKSGQKITGLYSIEKDNSDGKTRIRFEDPNKAKSAENAKTAETADGASDVRQLKTKRDSLKIKIKQEADDAQKVEQLKKKLAAVEKEIRQAK